MSDFLIRIIQIFWLVSCICALRKQRGNQGNAKPGDLGRQLALWRLHNAGRRRWTNMDVSGLEIVALVFLCICGLNVVWVVASFLYTTFVGSWLRLNVDLAQYGPWAGDYSNYLWLWIWLKMAFHLQWSPVLRTGSAKPTPKKYFKTSKKKKIKVNWI